MIEIHNKKGGEPRENSIYRISKNKTVNYDWIIELTSSAAQLGPLQVSAHLQLRNLSSVAGNGLFYVLGMLV